MTCPACLLCELLFPVSLQFNSADCEDSLQGKGLDAAAAAVRVSGLELGGLAGSLSAGAPPSPTLPCLLALPCPALPCPACPALHTY